jgi:hypothetical protein
MLFYLLILRRRFDFPINLQELKILSPYGELPETLIINVAF